jgi:hypothetical protein
MKDDLDTTEAGRRKLARAKEVLAEKALTIHQLAGEIHCSKVHAYRYIALLRGERPHHPRVIFIANWPYAGEKRPRRVPAFRLMVTGEEKDMEKPANLTRAERVQRKVERMRTDKELNRRVNLIRRIRHRIRTAGDQLHPLPAGFFKT